jgi:hypothetical protein
MSAIDPNLHKAIRALAANPHMPSCFAEVITAALNEHRPEIAMSALHCMYLDKIGWCLHMIIKDGIVINDS